MNTLTVRWLTIPLGLVVALACVLQSAEPRQVAKSTDAVPEKLTPAVAAGSFTVPDDLRFDQVLAEPVVKQPVSMSFDERGRLWVVQYLQYPHPAGLKMLSRDVYWRVVYDRVPPPPPNHFRGADRITIHEDTDGDGVFDKHTVFVEGLNIVTAAVPGRGGVWVLNPPYLLFYPTAAGGDRPSGDPVVHLQGFGLEDTHSCASSLRWGPDGWLYGAHGSTVTASITRPGDKAKPVQMIGQHIWRYHPEKKRFEVFAEGGGNAFGVEIDSKGNLYSGHNGGDTRGFHYVQGGYYRKGFEKHGVLANPYTFGFFEAMKHNKAQRFSHTFVIDEAPGLPQKYRGKLFAVEPLQGRVMMSEIWADRSSLQTKDLTPVVKSKDTWFRPVDIKPAPDGSLFVADFYESKIAHLNHNAGLIDRESGRIYRLAAKDAPTRPIDLGKKSSLELVELLRSDNRWVRQTALRLLGDRRDASVVPALRAMLRDNNGQTALEALWALNLSRGFDAVAAESLLEHREPAVRAWTVRLLADDGVLGKLAAKVADLAGREEDVHVRSQWAASARRLPAAEGLPIVARLLRHDEDARDIHVPLLLWWAIEANCGKNRDDVVALLRDSTLWQSRLVEEAVLARLAKRFAMAGTQKDLQACAELFRLAPERRHGQLLLKGLEEAFKGRSIAGLPDELIAEVGKLGGGSLAFAVRQGRPEAIEKALAILTDSKAKPAVRLDLIEVFGEAKQPKVVPVLLGFLADGQTEEMRRAALGALLAYGDDRIGAAVVKHYPHWTGELRETADTLLLSRKSWSAQWLSAVDAGAITPRSISRDTVRKLLLHRDDKIKSLVLKHWGDVSRGATTAEMQKEVERLVVVVSTGTGDPYVGSKLFLARCASCHALHGKGGAVGPDLTPFKRDEAHQLLLHIVNPSAEIREGYENHVVSTESGRTLSGVLVEKDARVVVLRTADGQKVVLPKDDVAEMSVSGVSLMPENLLQGLAEQEVRDLFAYLRTSQPLNERKKK